MLLAVTMLTCLLFPREPTEYVNLGLDKTTQDLYGQDYQTCCGHGWHSLHSQDSVFSWAFVAKRRTAMVTLNRNAPMSTVPNLNSCLAFPISTSTFTCFSAHATQRHCSRSLYDSRPCQMYSQTVLAKLGVRKRRGHAKQF